MKNKCPCYDGVLVEIWKNFCEQYERNEDFDSYMKMDQNIRLQYT